MSPGKKKKKAPQIHRTPPPPQQQQKTIILPIWEEVPPTEYSSSSFVIKMFHICTTAMRRPFGLAAKGDIRTVCASPRPLLAAQRGSARSIPTTSLIGYQRVQPLWLFRRASKPVDFVCPGKMSLEEILERERDLSDQPVGPPQPLEPPQPLNTAGPGSCPRGFRNLPKKRTTPFPTGCIVEAGRGKVTVWF